MSGANRQTRLAGALSIGCVFAFLTWIMLDGTIRTHRFDSLLRQMFYFVLPGTFISMVIGGNVHIISTWGAILANFAFYFGLTYIVFTLWSRRGAGARRNDRSNL